MEGDPDRCLEAGLDDSSQNLQRKQLSEVISRKVPKKYLPLLSLPEKANAAQ
jgi:hypothetical protein